MQTKQIANTKQWRRRRIKMGAWQNSQRLYQLMIKRVVLKKSKKIR